LFAVDTLLDGEPIINLPPKSVELKKVEFSDEERNFYSRLEADSRAQFQVWFHCERTLEFELDSFILFYFYISFLSLHCFDKKIKA
jgi:hypothetical protein